LHKARSTKSPVISIVIVDKGSIVSFDFGVKELLPYRKEFGKLVGVNDDAKINTTLILGKSFQITVKPGILRAVSDGSADTFNFKKGDIIEEMQYLGEGECLYRYKGNLFQEHPCIDDNLSLKKESEMITEWWVEVMQNGISKGWLLIDANAPLRIIDTVK
jgi:hypothetical protein